MCLQVVKIIGGHYQDRLCFNGSVSYVQSEWETTVYMQGFME